MMRYKKKFQTLIITPLPIMWIIVLLILCIGRVEFANAERIQIGMYGTWGKDSKYYMNVLKENGYQIIVSTDVGYASRLSLKCLYPLWLTKEIANDPEKWSLFLSRLKRTIEKYKGNPSIIGWYVADEPDWQQIPVDKIQEATNLIKSIDKKIPTFVVLTIPNSWHKYLPYFDEVAIDPYLDNSNLYVGRKTNKVKDWIDKLKYDLKQLKLNKPIWVVLGAFELKGKQPSSNSAFVKPTPNEFNKMVNIAVKENVKGIIVFSLTILEDSKHQEWNLMLDDLFLWDEVKKLPITLEQIGK